jgi:hypothetical protein
MTDRLFQIRNRKTGQWSRGGSPPWWSRTPKTWRGLGPLKCHLRMLDAADLKLCEVVEFAIVRREEQVVSIDSLLADFAAADAQRIRRSRDLAADTLRSAA